MHIWRILNSFMSAANKVNTTIQSELIARVCVSLWQLCKHVEGCHWSKQRRPGYVTCITWLRTNKASPVWNWSGSIRREISTLWKSPVTNTDMKSPSTLLTRVHHTFCRQSYTRMNVLCKYVWLSYRRMNRGSMLKMQFSNYLMMT
jgi:hypothetical protein